MQVNCRRQQIQRPAATAPRTRLGRGAGTWRRALAAQSRQMQRQAATRMASLGLQAQEDRVPSVGQRAATIVRAAVCAQWQEGHGRTRASIRPSVRGTTSNEGVPLSHGKRRSNRAWSSFEPSFEDGASLGIVVVDRLSMF